jgi:hypothetical protein
VRLVKKTGTILADQRQNTVQAGRFIRKRDM